MPGGGYVVTALMKAKRNITLQFDGCNKFYFRTIGARALAIYALYVQLQRKVTQDFRE